MHTLKNIGAGTCILFRILILLHAYSKEYWRRDVHTLLNLSEGTCTICRILAEGRANTVEYLDCDVHTLQNIGTGTCILCRIFTKGCAYYADKHNYVFTHIGTSLHSMPNIGVGTCYSRENIGTGSATCLFCRILAHSCMLWRIMAPWRATLQNISAETCILCRIFGLRRAYSAEYWLRDLHTLQNINTIKCTLCRIMAQGRVTLQDNAAGICRKIN